eukprot:g17423.t1
MQGAHYVISTVGKPDYVETPDTMDILMPYLNGGDMHDLWKKCMKTKGCVSCEKGMCWDQLGPPYSNAYILALFYQATLGVQEIHSKGFVHMDIKSENIMLNCIDQKCFAHVIDLGLMGPRGALAHPGKQPPFYSDRAAHRISTYDPSTDPVLSGPEQSELDRLIISMLNPDHETRIGTAEILQRLMGYLLTMPDFTPEQRAMQRETCPCPNAFGLGTGRCPTSATKTSPATPAATTPPKRRKRRVTAGRRRRRFVNAMCCVRARWSKRSSKHLNACE